MTTNTKTSPLAQVGGGTHEGFLFATHAMSVVPESRRVELQWKEGEGYRAAA
ncbi:MAG: hypothetical protein IPL59_11415 [Candidatus Competibacteraceae bacterium]|nr:hypothetical protein [Candidatus Competibacteraceae bacterium]